MKPRIFINMHYMEIGGAERALLGLLNAIDTDRVDVDLFINQHSGEFMSLIPKKINLLPQIKKYSTIERPIRQIVKEGYLDIALARLIARLAHRRYYRKRDAMHQNDASIFHYVAKYTTPLLPSLKYLGEYDLAISFLTPHQIVKEKVNARKRVAWIHTDYSVSTVDEEAELPIWDAYEYITSISPDVTATFTKAFPSLKGKIVEIENIISPEFVRLQAKLLSPKEMQGDFVKICSVGRFCEAKNYDNVPFMAQKLRERGLRFRWYIIGFGDDTLIRENIAKTKTEDCVILLGKKENPYPYIAACDIYAQPSRYEGKSVTVREAQILCRPVLVTNYPTAASQITNGIDGIICEMDNDAIASALYDLATSPDKRDQLSSYLKTHDYGNEAEVNKIYELISE